MTGVRRLEGSTAGAGLRIGIVASKFNGIVVEPLLAGALETLAEQGVRDSDITIARVPGAFEIPLVAQRLAASGRHDAIVCLGAIVRGETPHFDLVARESARGIASAARSSGVPVLLGILATDNLEQAFDRAGGKLGNRGSEAAAAAIEMARLLETVEGPGAS